MLLCSSSTLLALEARLGVAQGVALVLQLLVRRLQLLLLRLQLLGLALGLVEQLLEPRAIARRAHRDADRVGRAPQELAVDLDRRAQEAELDHRLDRIPSAAAGAISRWRGWAWPSDDATRR